MELPVLPFKIPEMALPFDIPVLMHPPVDHIVIALPLVVLLLELVNLVVKKRAVGVVSFFLLLLTITGAIAAYYTGITDGKEAFDTLSQAGQADLKAHKLMGTYLMFASVVVLIFKLLASMIKRGIVKGLYFLILILFVAGIIKQGKEGGELVYKYGANVARVSELKGEIDTLKGVKSETPSAAEKKVAEPVPAEEKKASAQTPAEEKKTEEPTPEKAEEAVPAMPESPEPAEPAAQHPASVPAEKSMPEENAAKASVAETIEHHSSETH